MTSSELLLLALHIDADAALAGNMKSALRGDAADGLAGILKVIEQDDKIGVEWETGVAFVAENSVIVPSFSHRALPSIAVDCYC